MASGSDRGVQLSHTEPHLIGSDHPPPRSQQKLEDRQSWPLSVDAAQDLRVRERLQIIAQHAITSREVHDEPPTLNVSTTQEDESALTSLATSTEPGLGTQSATVANSSSSPNDTTTPEFQVVRGNASEGPANMTAKESLLSNSSGGQFDFPGNRLEPSSTASGSFLIKQVPATTQKPWTPDNSSEHAIVSICLSRMEIVWIVLAISVPVSSCCKSPFSSRLVRGPFFPGSPPVFLSASFSCASDGVLHEAEEEVVEPGEQPELLEQRHHHGLLQQARRGAAQTDPHPGERGLSHYHTITTKKPCIFNIFNNTGNS